MKLKNIKLKKIIYPAISAIFFLSVAIIFIFTAKFLSGALKTVFEVDSREVESQLVKLDLDTFYKVADKLGMELTINPSALSEEASLADNQQQEAGDEVVAVEPNAVATSTATTSVPTAPPPPPPPPDKLLVKISVLNGAGTAGLAADLKNFLIGEGWAAANTGNASAAGQTIIKIKASKADYSPLIRESVSKKYTLGAEEILSESEEYDIIIIIGK